MKDFLAADRPWVDALILGLAVGVLSGAAVANTGYDLRTVGEGAQNAAVVTAIVALVWSYPRTAASRALFLLTMWAVFGFTYGVLAPAADATRFFLLGAAVGTQACVLFGFCAFLLSIFRRGRAASRD